MITIGSPLALPESLWTLYARLTTLRFAEAWKERFHVGGGIALNDRTRFACLRGVKDAERGCMLLTSERMLKV